MANIYSYGSIHWCSVAFKGKTNQTKIRPVFIVDTDSGQTYFFRITSKKGKIHQRKYRPMLQDWKKYGLDKPSYINIEVPLAVTPTNIFNTRSFISQATERDISNLENYIINLGYKI